MQLGIFLDEDDVFIIIIKASLHDGSKMDLKLNSL